MENDRIERINTTTLLLPTGLLKYRINENVDFRLEFQSFTSRRRNDLIKKSSLHSNLLKWVLKQDCGKKKAYS
ncbi:MAG: hypothetical protein H0U39_07140 [Segetibacter sp.]|nr:hypothetical protein [Segetibacter sp.]